MVLTRCCAVQSLYENLNTVYDRLVHRMRQLTQGGMAAPSAGHAQDGAADMSSIILAELRTEIAEKESELGKLGQVRETVVYSYSLFN